MITGSEKKRLAKNTLYLYLRMFLVMGVSLYTSRVVLQQLGVSDYGLFNVVGGFVSVFTFINTALTGGSQRFLTFALGKKRIDNVKKIFCVCFTLHFTISILFLVLMESLGIYFIYHVLNIPDGRNVAAMWALHFILFSVCIDILRSLFDADIIANEKMDYYAYFSILDVALKLIIVYSLSLVGGHDKLILYSFFYLLTTIITMLVSGTYCMLKFKETTIKFKFDKKMIVEIGSYTGWNILSHMSSIISLQGINIVLNIFYGTVLNAARGIAVQVYGAVSRLTLNYVVATVPQIIKLYAANEIKDMYNLVKNASKFSFFLFLFIGIPLFFETDFLLSKWLDVVPEHSAVFTRILVLQSGFMVISMPVSRILVAAGKVRNINIFDFILQILTFILVCFLFVVEVDVDLILLISILPSILNLFYYLYSAHVFTGINPFEYIREVIPQIMLVFIISLTPSVILCLSMVDSFKRVLFLLIINTLTVSFSAFLLGIDNNTRLLLLEKIKKYISK